jgi:gliding motility-associated-like protein
MNLPFPFYRFFLLFTILPAAYITHAQPCSVSITSFPYSESFELYNGNWTTGGTATDWVWGTPAKPVINAAGAGNRCWITGGLANASYNNGENSWLQSPCFDFSALQYPQISFKIFWETERRFDGASFQYSIDAGNTWVLLGSTNSNTNCLGENWYNTPAISYLINASGWSGNIQSNSGSCLGGSGSAGWITARHTLEMLSGEADVRFRFIFGAGTTCNAYDGFAIDDVKIEEVPANSNTVSATCISTNELNFSSSATCVSSYVWNFDDAASGAADSSNAVNPVHQFSAPGTYNVRLTTNFAGGPPVISTKQVVIIGLASSTNWPGRCIGVFDATLLVTPAGSNTPYFYSWNTNPAQTGQSVSNVSPGNYTITVSSVDACSASASFVIKDSPGIFNVLEIKDADCGSNNGSIFTAVSGGTPPYQYLWSDGSTGTSLQNLAPGVYDVDVTDAANCFNKSFNIVVNMKNNNLAVNLGEDIGLCPGETVVLNPGTYKNYLWQDGSARPTFTVKNAGIYYVEVINDQGCSGNDTIQVKEDCSNIYFPSAFTPNNDSDNDGFGPLGNLAAVKKYSFSVYNRYGQCVFLSNDPFKKWDGTFKGDQFNTGSFVWMANYLYNGKLKSVKGTVTVIR